MSPVRETEAERRDEIEEGGSEGETTRGQGDIVPGHAAGVVKDITGGGALETGPVPVPDPDHRLVQERDAGDRHQSGTSQRDFLSRWSRKSMTEKCQVSCSLGVSCSWKGSEVGTRVWSTSRSCGEREGSKTLLRS